MTLNVSNCPAAGTDRYRQLWPLRTWGRKMSPKGRAAETERFILFLLGISQLPTVVGQPWPAGKHQSGYSFMPLFFYQYDGAESKKKKVRKPES